MQFYSTVNGAIRATDDCIVIGSISNIITIIITNEYYYSAVSFKTSTALNNSR